MTSPGTLVVVTGSREWENRHALIWRTLSSELSSMPRDMGHKMFVMHGCAKGADSYAAQWCRSQNGLVVRELRMPAPWATDGKRAGAIRNSQMVNVAISMRLCGWHVVCHAFGQLQHRGRARDMVHKLEGAGFDVTKHEAEPPGRS